jgi:glucose/arabinose dehydrogenase
MIETNIHLEGMFSMKRIRLLPVLLSMAVLLVACGQPRQTPSSAPTASPMPASSTSHATVTSVPSASSVSPQLPAATQSAVPPASSDLPSATAASLPSPTATTSTAGVADPGRVQIEIEAIVGSLDRPLGASHAGDGSGRLFILEKPGRIRILRQGALLDRPFLDLSDRVNSSASEQGLLGVAFHPRYAGNGRFFVNYTDSDGDTVVAQFLVSDDPDRADPDSEQLVLALDQPAGNHNGGHLAFGPDGYLYIGTGDGGGAGDQFGNGQNGQTLLGAMLRLDINGELPYTTPLDNPFIGDGSIRDEIWALGLRNPWRYSFDRLTGDLYIADVGQNMYEEINHQPAASSGGENYGWPIMEGLHCFPADRSCEQSGLVLPIQEYDHSEGCSVTGGYVYRGQHYPALQGIYLFGDYCSGSIWGMAPGSAGGWQVARLAQTGLQITSFAEDEAGELYLTDFVGGVLYRLRATPTE